MTFQLTCMAGELARALSLASQVSGREKQVPILRAVKVEIKKGTVSITAFNMDHGATITIAGDGKGIAYIEAALLDQKARVLRQGEPVTIIGADDGKSATVTQGRTRWKLPIMDGSGFPDFVAPIKGDPLDFKSEVFFAALAIAKVAINPADDRIIGRGPFLDMRDGFDVVATDGHRFTSIRANLPALPVNIILPTNAAVVIGNMFKGSDRIKVLATDKAITVEDDGIFYKSKLIEGDYPDWRRARDKQSEMIDASIIVDRQAFSDALVRVASISENGGKDGGKSTAVKVTVANGECELYSRNRNAEEGTDYCEAIGEHDGVFGVGIDALSDMLGTIHSDRMKISFSSTSTESAIILAPEPQSSEADYRFVMPMRIA